MKQKSLKKNLFYNIIYQIITIVIPLITTPYIARIIGPYGSGVYSYTYTVANYFMIFAMLGIANYGNRLIAQNRDDRKKLNIEFSSLLIFHIAISLIVMIFYMCFTIFFVNEYKIYFFLQSIYIVSALFDISWLFFGLEEFKTTVIRNIVVRLISIILIFLFVKTTNDLIKYILIMSSSTLLSQLVLYPFLKKNGIEIVKVSLKDIIKHFKPMLILFIPVIAVSIYKMMDKIMLGRMVDINEVGFYEYGERIINLPMSLITALGTVMLPRMSNLVSKGDDESLKSYIDKSMQFVLFISCAMCIGIIVISRDFIPLFLGDKYIKTATLVQVLALTIPIISFANVIRTQYLIPKSMDREFTISLLLGALLNFLLNIFLIKKYQSIGASISTVIAEFTVMLYQIIKVKDRLPIKKYFEYNFVFLVKAIIMGIIIYLLNYRLKYNVLMKVITNVLTGICIYFAINYNYILKNFHLRKLNKNM